MDKRLGGPQSRSGLGGVEKNSQPLLGLEPPIIQPVAQRYTIELYRLQRDNILHPFSAEDKSAWSYNFTPTYVFTFSVLDNILPQQNTGLFGDTN